MIRKETVLIVADNSGVNKARCIGINGHTGDFVASLGDIILCSCIDVQPNGKIKKGDKRYAVIVRTKAKVKRDDGSYISFDDNAVVLIDKANEEPLGTAVFGAVAREIRKRFPKTASLAPEVI